MKTRIDFVSNSSSCSFVLKISKTLPLDDFIVEACNGCLKHVKDDDNKDFVKQQDIYNNIVLNFHLNASELVYLGGLKIENIKSTIAKDDTYFQCLKNDIANLALPDDERVIENTDDHIVIESNDIIYGMAIPKHKVDYVTTEYHWNNDYECDIERQKKVAKEIVKFAKNYSDTKTDYKCRHNSATYFISQSTIWNTRALIAAGYEVKLEKWMDLDKLDEILKNGDRIFNIRVNNGGDGVDEDALYSFGGWDGEDVFNDMKDIEVMHAESS